MKGMPLKLKAYTLFIMALGMIALYFGIIGIKPAEISGVVFFIILGVIAESLTIKLDRNMCVSMGFAIGLAVVLIFQSNVASIFGFMSLLLWVEYRDGAFIHIFNSSVYKRIFNGSVYAITLAIAGLVYNTVAVRYETLTFLNLNVFGILCSILVYILINILLYAILMSILENMPIRKTLNEIMWLAVNILGLSPLGILIATAYLNYGWFAVVIFFGPLLIARYSFKMYLDMRHVYFETISALSNAMEAKDKYTQGHSYRVADYAVGIAEQMELKANKIEQIRTAATLHDIGKIGVADSILNKNGKLEENEYLLIQKHPELGAKILSGVDFLAEVANIIKYHHERCDGKGYPEGLTDAQIPIEAAILTVADAYDAMTSDRPYRRAMDQSVAIKILLKESGSQFNPIVVKALQEYLNKNKKFRVISNVS